MPAAKSAESGDVGVLHPSGGRDARCGQSAFALIGHRKLTAEHHLRRQTTCVVWSGEFLRDAATAEAHDRLGGAARQLAALNSGISGRFDGNGRKSTCQCFRPFCSEQRRPLSVHD